VSIIITLAGCEGNNITGTPSSFSTPVNMTGTQVDYVKNNDKDKSKFKKLQEISGYVSDKALAQKGGNYTRKQLMTYKEFLDLGIDDSIRHDTDPERMVWVITSKFSGTHDVDGKKVYKGEVTSIVDAETGDFLGFIATSELDKLKVVIR
jgi:hypothetical protein